MKRIFSLLTLGFCLLAQNAYPQTDTSQTSDIVYEYASIVVEYQYRKQVVHLTDAYYQTNSFEIHRQRELPQMPQPAPLQSIGDSVWGDTEPIAVNENQANLSLNDDKTAAQSPAAVRLYTIPSAAISPDSLQQIEEQLKREAQTVNYRLKGRYDNTYLFRMLAQYQTSGWEITEMEFSGSGEDVYDPQILFVLLRRVSQSDKNP